MGTNTNIESFFRLNVILIFLETLMPQLLTSAELELNLLIVDLGYV